MTFTDSHRFEVTDDGHAFHKRDGDTYADKTINGVDLDDSCRWMNEIDDIQQRESNTSGDYIMVGERVSNGEVVEISKKWGKERGEGKFKRQRSVPKSKMKKYPTKPKPKHSWHKRLSKVARELGDIELHTEEQANIEMSECYEQHEEEKEANEEQAAEQYLYEWCEMIDRKPGEFRVVEVLSPLCDITGKEIFDIDVAGVNRSPALIKNAFWTEWWRNNKGLWELPWWPSTVNAARRYIFTHWDEDSKMYRYKPLHYLDSIDWRKPIQDQSGFSARWKIHVLNGFPPVTGKMVGRWLDIMTEESIQPEIGGIDWKQIWMRMDFMRTGLIRNHVYNEGNMSLCYLRGTSVPYILFYGDAYRHCQQDYEDAGDRQGTPRRDLDYDTDEDYYDY
jgi:hypothetical protein